MNPAVNEQETIRAYLLGRAAEEDLRRVEERLLLDAAFYEELTFVEDELIDEYLRAELTASDRQSFESHFMSGPERRGKLRFAAALNKHLSSQIVRPLEEFAAGRASEPASDVSNQLPNKRSFFKFLPVESRIVPYALAATVLVSLFALTWVFLKNRTSPTPGKVLAVELAPGSLSRDSGDTEVKALSIPPDIETIHLQLNLPEGQYISYEAVLQDANLRTLSTNTDLKTQSSKGRRIVMVEIPHKSLSPGAYRVKLRGGLAAGNFESVATYFFRILSN